MAKKITGKVKLQVPAGQANPSPPIGPAPSRPGTSRRHPLWCARSKAVGQASAGQPACAHGLWGCAVADMT